MSESLFEALADVPGGGKVNAGLDPGKWGFFIRNPDPWGMDDDVPGVFLGIAPPGCMVCDRLIVAGGECLCDSLGAGFVIDSCLCMFFLSTIDSSTFFVF